MEDDWKMATPEPNAPLIRTYLRHVFLVVAVEDDGRATDDVVFDELVQVAVGSVEGDEVCVGWEAVNG